MKNWEWLKVGDRVRFVSDDFDGKVREDGTVKEMYTDHAIVVTDNAMTLWLDDDTQSLFQRI